jgi:hypothetical protein
MQVGIDKFSGRGGDYCSTKASHYKSSLSNVSTMGKIFLLVFFIVLFEGALRKWVSPSLTTPLIFLRDALAFFGIIFSYRRGFMKEMPTATGGLVIWSLLVILWGLLQVIFNASSPFLLAIGLRFWLLYFWFSYAVAVSINRYDFEYITKMLMTTLLFVAPLVIIQISSPAGAFINKQIEDDETQVFMLAAGLVRTTGTFTFTAGQSIYVGLLGPIILACITSRNILMSSQGLQYIIIFLYFITVFLSGSRTALATAVFQLLCLILFEFFYFSRRDRKNGILKILLILFSLLSLPLIFLSAFDATQQRIEDASGYSNFLFRVLTSFIGEVTIDTLSLLGYGLGAGTNYANSLSGTMFALGESESTRVLMEGGLIGLLFVFLKVFVTVFGLKKSLDISKVAGNSLPFLLWITTAIALFMWQINGQLTINALGYILLALSIASLRVYKNAL